MMESLIDRILDRLIQKLFDGFGRNWSKHLDVKVEMKDGDLVITICQRKG